MPNALTSVVVTPGAIASGGSVIVDVGYTAVTAGNLEISCSGSFTVSPSSVSLSAAAVSVSIPLTITRGSATAPHECMLHFNFDGDDRNRIVEIN